jgi:hypothetical protein
VNHLHLLRGALRGYLRTLPPIYPTEPIERFLTVSDEVTVIRGRINHLPEQITNKSAAKGSVPPLLGVIAYCLVDYTREQDDAPSAAKQVYVVSLLGGAMTHSTHDWPVPNPAGRDPIGVPVDLIEFSSLKSRVSLTKCIEAIWNMDTYFDDVVRADCAAQATRAASDKGIGVQELLAPQDELPMPVLKFGGN